MQVSAITGQHSATMETIELSSHISGLRDFNENILHFKILLGFNVLLFGRKGNKFRLFRYLNIRMIK